MRFKDPFEAAGPHRGLIYVYYVNITRLTLSHGSASDCCNLQIIDFFGLLLDLGNPGILMGFCQSGCRVIRPELYEDETLVRLAG